MILVRVIRTLPSACYGTSTPAREKEFFYLLITLTLQVYCDSDWASCPMSHRSVMAYLLQFGQAPISWKTKKQGTVSRSSATAEYRAMASATSEFIWVHSLTKFLGNSKPLARLHCDN